MTTAFTGAPNVDYEWEPSQEVGIVTYAGSRYEQRASWQTISRRTYVWTMTRRGAEARNIDSFFRDRNQEVSAFYIQDPDDQLRSGVTLGTSVAGQTVFTLPTSGNESRFYPKDDANVVVYDDAVATAATVTVSTDNRTFTLSAAPVSGSVMTVDFYGYRLVRLLTPCRWKGLGPDWFVASPQFKEVPV